MSVSAAPQKVHLLRADQDDAGVQDVLENAKVEIDTGSRSVAIAADGRNEQGNIEGDIIASDQALKITCGRDGDDVLSIHMVFGDAAELDSVVGDLEADGLEVVRSEDDPQYRTEA